MKIMKVSRSNIGAELRCPNMLEVLGGKFQARKWVP